ncbi:MAG: phosphate signaling complex protein PhoU [Candidatus Hydrogenedentales bacterium]
MSRHLLAEIERLKTRILELSDMVEQSVHQAVKSLQDGDKDTAQAVIDNDSAIDLAEVDIEEECQKILALHQPVAHDLRFIIAVLKINTELERIGDAAVSIADHASVLSAEEHISIPFDFLGMAERAKSMLRKSLDALVKLDAELAFFVINEDDVVDSINRGVYRLIEKSIQKNPERVSSLIHLLGVSRHIERIADHASNIAENVIYLVEGRIIRHHKGEYKRNDSGN